MTDLHLGLTEEDRSILMEILQRYVPDVEIWAFGSRVQGRARPFSDLDLVIVSEKALPLRLRAELTNALSESRLPIKIDILEWVKTNAAFREIIAREYKLLRSKAA